MIEVPVFFDDECAPDLRAIAEFSGLAPDEVIGIFTSQYTGSICWGSAGLCLYGRGNSRIAAPRRSHRG